MRRRQLLAGAAGTTGAGFLGMGTTLGGSKASSNVAAKDEERNDVGRRPGPPVLHDDPVTAPQFENGPGWNAAPLLVSGTDGYVDGEYLYQDFVYDDHGANTTDTLAPPHPAITGQSLNGPTTGDIVYPTDEESYRYNAADLLEFRARLVSPGAPPRQADARAGEIVYRFTLTTMVEPDAAVLAVGIDTSGEGTPDAMQTDWGHGLGELGAPVDHVLVTWGTGAVLDGERLSDERVSLDTERNQIEVRVPLTPGSETWRHYCVTGLHDGEGVFVQPVDREPTETEPGGANGRNPPPVFNVGFRFEEPMGNVNVNMDDPQREIEQAASNRGSRGLGYGHWREHRQAHALDARDISALHTDIDFEALRSGVTDRRIPEHGYLNRLYSSRYSPGEGIDVSPPVISSHIQPYTVYIPESYDGSAASLHVELHGNSATLNQTGVYTPNYLRAVGEERDAIVLAVEGRGPGLSYKGLAELDVFEAWNDLRHRYSIDFDRITLGGYSMGGFGTFKLAAHYPDLFARGFSVVGAAGDLRFLENIRHVPILMWNGTNDELVGPDRFLPTARRLRELGYRHEFDLFLGYDHFLFGGRDKWGHGGPFLDADYRELGTATVDRAPERVTYRRIPELDVPEYGLVHDGAYWVSDIGIVADAADGRVDAISHGSGYSDPEVVHYREPGTDPDPHVKRGTEWKAPLDGGRRANRLELDLQRVESVTVHLAATDLDTTQPLVLAVDTTHEVTVRLVDDDHVETVTLQSGETERTVRFNG